MESACCQSLRNAHLVKTRFSNYHSTISFAGMITNVDVAIGKVVQALKRKGMYDNSVIMFSSDVSRLQSQSICRYRADLFRFSME